MTSQKMTESIVQIEELSINAWAPLQSMNYDGWVIRVSDGYTKRANAVHPIYASRIALNEKIAFCEALYTQRNFPTIFKLTAASHPDELDAVLAQRGYVVAPGASVQTCDLSAFDGIVPADVQIETEPSAQWLAGFQRMQNISDNQTATLAKILANILPLRGFASVQLDGEVIACGLGVVQSGFVGLYDIITDVRLRRRGYGKMIVDNLLAWGKQEAAQTAYLQVMLENAPALRLYEEIGFQESYRYWYRVKAF